MKSEWTECAREKQEMENRPIHWFGLTYLNKTIGKMCGKKNSKTYNVERRWNFFHFHLTHNIFDYCIRRFFFGLVYNMNPTHS